MLHFNEKSPDRSDQLHLGGYQEFDQYLILVMINNMAKERGEFEIVVNVKAKLEIWQHCEFVNPLPDDKILDGSYLKQSADDNFKLMKIAESSLNK